MKTLAREELFSLEQYAVERDAFRQRVLAHKQHRSLDIGPSVRLLFEDRLTIQYQIQEMLRVERIFEPAAIVEELAAYVPLIPDGSNLKATMLIEFPDEQERRRELTRLAGIEAATWLQAGGHKPVFAIADEDLDRTDEGKTSAVHFLRFEFSSAMVDALAKGAALNAGVDHENYCHTVAPVPDPVRQALVQDFDLQT